MATPLKDKRKQEQPARDFYPMSPAPWMMQQQVDPSAARVRAAIADRLERENNPNRMSPMGRDTVGGNGQGLTKSDVWDSMFKPAGERAGVQNLGAAQVLSRSAAGVNTGGEMPGAGALYGHAAPPPLLSAPTPQEEAAAIAKKYAAPQPAHWGVPQQPTPSAVAANGGSRSPSPTPAAAPVAPAPTALVSPSAAPTTPALQPGQQAGQAVTSGLNTVGGWLGQGLAAGKDFLNGMKDSPIARGLLAASSPLLGVPEVDNIMDVVGRRFGLGGGAPPERAHPVASAPSATQSPAPTSTYTPEMEAQDKQYGQQINETGMFPIGFNMSSRVVGEQPQGPSPINVGQPIQSTRLGPSSVQPITQPIAQMPSPIRPLATEDLFQPSAVPPGQAPRFSMEGYSPELINALSLMLRARRNGAPATDQPARFAF